MGPSTCSAFTAGLLALATLTAQGDVRLRATFLDENGKPIQGVQLTTIERKTLDIGKCLASRWESSDALGNLAVHVPLSRLRNRVILAGVRGRMFVHTQVGQRQLWRGDLDIGCIVLPRGRTIHGLVQDTDGKPIAGASILAVDVLKANQLRLIPNQPTLVTNTRSDAKGRFRLEGILRRGALVTVRAAGRRVEHIPHARPGAPLVVRLHKASRISGQVLDPAGRPIRARVLLRFAGSEELVQQVTADDGKYALDLAHPGPYRVFTAPFREWGHTFWTTTDILDRRATLHLTVDPKFNGHVELRVRDAKTRAPVADFVAAAVWKPPPRSLMIPVEESRSVEKGRVRLPGPVMGEPGNGTILVRAEGYATHTLPNVSAEGEEPVTVDLQTEAVIVGQVLSTDKLPIAGLRIIPWSRENHRPDVLALFSSPAFAITDEKGRFRISGLAAGRWDLHARHPNLPDIEITRVKLRTGQTLDLDSIVVKTGHRIAGKVEAVAGPLPDWVWVSRTRGIAVRPYRAQLGAEGRFTTGRLTSGEFGVRGALRQPCLPGTFAMTRIGATVLGGADRKDLTFVSQARRVQGKVAQVGAPIPDGRLLVVKLENARPEPVAMVHRDGSYEFFTREREFQLQVMDVATGAVLYQSEAGLRVAAGKTLQHDIRLELALIRLELAPEHEGQPVVAGRLVIEVQHPEPEGSRSFGMFANYGFPLPGMPRGWIVRPGQTETTLYLPPVETRVEVFRGDLRTGKPYAQGESAARIEFVPATGRTNKVVLEVEALGG